MSLNKEWLDRIDAWRKELAGQVCLPVGRIELEGFVTREHLPAERAGGGGFKPMPAGTAWGAMWEYGWFRGQARIPPQAAGRQVAVRLDVGKEGLVFVNGVAAGAMDKQHQHVFLSDRAREGDTYELLMEAYAGHGPTPCHAGPTPPERQVPPAPPETQATVGRSSLLVVDEELYQLRMDVETLYHLRNALDADSLRVAEIDDGLKDFTLIADFELPRDEMLKTARQARQRLRPLLECVNGSTSPVMYCFGHGHLDTAWLWPLPEGRRKAARTISNQLALAERYPGYRFLMSQPAQHQWLMEDHGELHARLKKAVAAGSVIADGGMWVEADTNISGGEALIRQFLYGKRFMHEQYGVQSEVLWLPDVFGYSGAMPQIMAGCGIKYFSTAKIFWTYHGGDPFPYHDFLWEGIDGTTVLAHLHTDYNSQTDPATMIRRWRHRVQKDGMKARLVPFGWGDGGGGPDRDHLEYVARQGDLEGCPKLRYSTPQEFFQDLAGWGTGNRYVGELYYQAHRGVLTSQARTKRGNRKAELALREAEMWGAIASGACGFDWPAEEMEKAWKLVLLNQFHDILPGSSIQRVYEQAEADHAEAIAVADRVSAAARARLVRQGEALAVFNSLNWPRRVLVELPAGAAGAIDDAGEGLRVQDVEGRKLVEVETPSCGWTTLKLAGGPGRRRDEGGCGAAAAPAALENELLRVDIDGDGEVTGILDKRSGRQMAAGACNHFMMFKDTPTQFDAWDIDSMYPRQPVELERRARVEVVASGPLVAAVRVRRRLNNSEMTQDISLRRGSARVDFATTIDWREKHKLLKVGFAVAVHANEALHEIQFGHIRRPNHYSRPYDADRFEVCNHKWTALAEELGGAAVLNDCKYGVNVLGNQINLTLLRAPLAPDVNADQGRQEFTYAFYCWPGSFAESGLVREGYDLNCPPSVCGGDAGRRSALTVTAPNVIVEAVKPAEDGSGDLVVRMYEASRIATRCELMADLPLRAAEATDMLERPCGRLPVGGGAVALDFRPFEVKTIRLKPSRQDTPARGVE